MKLKIDFPENKITMTKIIAIVCTIFLLSGFIDASTKIMPLGDSITYDDAYRAIQNWGVAVPDLLVKDMPIEIISGINSKMPIMMLIL